MIIDEFSKKKLNIFYKYKSELPHKVFKKLNEIESMTSKEIKEVRCDNAP